MCLCPQAELKELEPVLQQKSVETAKLMERLEVDQKKANEVWQNSWHECDDVKWYCRCVRL